MLTRFFGMYRVKLYHLRRNVKFVIMNSVYYTDKYLQTFYDLKGSVIGRDAKPGQAVKKDNDLRRKLPQEALALSPHMRGRVREQLEKDCKFLEEMDIMDYSMLVGVHHVPQNTDDRSIATSGFKGNRSSRGLRSQRNQDDDSLGGDSLNSSLPDNDAHSLSSQSKQYLHQQQQQQQQQQYNNQKPEAVGSLSPPVSPVKRSTDAISRRQLNDSISAFFAEDGLDDDDNSYLLGSEHRPKNLIIGAGGGSLKPNPDSERKKQATVEKLYWPFHNLYDIHGHRRMIPMSCPTCNKIPCGCHEEEDAKVLAGYDVPKFVEPLSDRKDGGLEMDTTGYELPLVYPRKQGPQLYRGKIFYMGIIDILQEYTSRKVVESKYRMMQTQGKPEASCVSPHSYGERFLRFFDEYTRGMADRASATNDKKHVGVEVTVIASGEVVGETGKHHAAVASSSSTPSRKKDTGRVK